MNVRLWLTASIALALGGCDFAPRYALPSMALSAKFKDATAEGAALPANEKWWRTFRDATLDNLQTEVDAANPDLAAAIASNEAEQARAQAALSGLLPNVDAIGHITGNKQSNNRPLRSSGQPAYFGDNLIGAQASYEVAVSLGPQARPPRRARTRLLRPASNCMRSLRATISICAASTTRPSSFRIRSASIARRLT
jgi:outer membrane protein TolC